MTTQARHSGPRGVLEVTIYRAFTAVLTGHDPEVLNQSAGRILAAADAYAAALIEDHARTPRRQRDPRLDGAA